MFRPPPRNARRDKLGRRPEASAKRGAIPKSALALRSRNASTFFGPRRSGGPGGGPAIPAGPAGWADPTGLSWDYAWDFTDAPGGSADVPALVGGVDLAVDAGSYTVGSSFPSTVAAGNGYMAGTGLAETVANTAFVATLTGVSATTDPVHIRFIGRAETGSNWDILLGGNSTSQARIRLSQFVTTDRWFVRVRNTGGAALIQTELSAPIDDVVMFDAVIENDGSSGSRLELWLNGQSVLVTSATLWDGLETDDLRALAESMDAGWVGVRRGTLTQAQHDAAVEDVLSNVISSQSWTWLWDADDRGPTTWPSSSTASNSLALPALGTGATDVTPDISTAALPEGLAVELSSSSRWASSTGWTIPTSDFTVRCVASRPSHASGTVLFGFIYGLIAGPEAFIRYRLNSAAGSIGINIEGQDPASPGTGVTQNVIYTATPPSGFFLVDVAVEIDTNGDWTVTVYENGTNQGSVGPFAIGFGHAPSVGAGIGTEPADRSPPADGSRIRLLGVLDGAVSEVRHRHDNALLGVGT